MKKLLYVCLALVFVGCTKNKEEKEYNAINMDNNVKLAIVNANNEDLLNPNNSNALDLSKVHIYYMVNGVKILANTGTDNPNGYKLLKLEQADGSYKYRLRVFLNPTVTEQKPKNTTIIEWNASDSDTLEAEYRVFQDSPVTLLEFWENGQSRWKIQDEDANPTKLVTLIK